MSIELLHLFLILTLISINGFFALAELAILSTNKLSLQEQANQGNLRAQTTLELTKQSGRFLSTVQIGITMVGVASGAIGGATIANTLANGLRDLPVIGGYAESIGVIAAILTITYLSLVIGELVPKQIALSNPERFAMLVAPIMQTVSKVFSPIAKLLSLSTNFVLKLIGVDTTRQSEVSVEELRLMIDAGAVTGVLEPIEETMLEQVLRFDDTRIKPLMTPRSDIAWLDIHTSQEAIKEFLINISYEKIPVADTNLDQILGMVYAHELLSQHLQNGHFDLHATLIPAVIVPEGFDLLQVLEHMRKHRTDLVFVLNEYGGVDGMVTTKDILEMIVGDLPESDELYDPHIVQRPDGSWLLDGMLTIEVFSEIMNIDLDDLEKSQVETLSGFVNTKLGKIPHTGDSFHAYGYYIEVVDMDRNRVDKVLVKKSADTQK